MPIDISELASRDDVRVIAFHHNAVDTITAMARHNESVGVTYGYESTVYLDQVQSFGRVVSQLVSRGFGNAAYVTKDGDLSLYVQENSGFVFGVIFFRDRKYDDAEVQPGTWSVHS